MTAFQRLRRGRYIGPVWIGIHGVPREREQRIIIDVNGVQHLTADQARRLGEEALALADQLQTQLGPREPLLRTHDKHNPLGVMDTWGLEEDALVLG
jgi:hypothetical protein